MHGSHTMMIPQYFCLSVVDTHNLEQKDVTHSSDPDSEDLQDGKKPVIQFSDTVV